MAERDALRLGAYKLSKTLGMGAFGKVKVAEHVATGHRVAVKMVNRQKVERHGMAEKMKREIAVLQACWHAHIIRLYEVIDTPTEIFMVLEYAPGGDLFDYVVSHGRLEEHDATRVVAQLLAGVAYIHERKIAHRDLKPENLLLDARGRLKVADFGLANVMRDGELLRTSCGSPNYAAPEVISGHLYAGPEVDAWSCGVVTFALLCGHLPFEDDSVSNLFRRIRAGMYSIPTHVPALARDLISRLLIVDPMARLSVPNARRHPWCCASAPRTMQPRDQLDEAALDATVAFMEQHGHTPQRDKIANAVFNKAKHGPDNTLRVTYELIADNLRVSPSSSVDIEDDDSEKPLAFPSRAPPVAEDDCDRQSAFGVNRKRWFLGIQSKKDPAAVMTEVFTALHSADCDWSVIDTYRVQARLAPPGCVIRLNLYKVQREVFLLDFQNVDGNWFSFLCLCGRIIRELQSMAAQRRKHRQERHRQQADGESGQQPPPTPLSSPPPF